jgi:hypothetical protein
MTRLSGPDAFAALGPGRSGRGSPPSEAGARGSGRPRRALLGRGGSCRRRGRGSAWTASPGSRTASSTESAIPPRSTTTGCCRPARHRGACCAGAPTGGGGGGTSSRDGTPSAHPKPPRPAARVGEARARPEPRRPAGRRTPLGDAGADARQRFSRVGGAADGIPLTHADRTRFLSTRSRARQLTCPRPSTGYGRSPPGDARRVRERRRPAHLRRTASFHMNGLPLVKCPTSFGWAETAVFAWYPAAGSVARLRVTGLR